MADSLRFDLCPETGIGSLMIGLDSGLLRVDLMPDEAASLKELMKSGDLEGARSLLTGIDPRVETAMTNAHLEALAGKVG